MSLVDYPARNFSLPPASVARKPLPKGPGQQTRPEIHIQPDTQPYLLSQQQPQISVQSHSRSRTASSSVFPETNTNQALAPLLPTQIPQQIPSNTNAVSYQAHMNQQQIPQGRRTLSNATTLTTSTNANLPVRQNSGSSLARSTSSRSGNSPSSYVVLMRKQKATVWSDRAQHEDPRVLAQQRAAKARAAAEVSNASLNARASASAGSSSITGGVRSKILHHGAAKAQQYIQTGLPQSGVPMRLSQNEIDENEEDEDTMPAAQSIHRRTDSGRSSLGSAGRVSSMYGLQHGSASVPAHAVSTGSTPPSGSQSRASPPDSRSPLSANETPVPNDYKRGDYFSPPKTTSGSRQGSPDESQFGGLSQLPQKTRNPDGDGKLSEAELRRRGSVDERTMTMSGYGKLFIANPDA